MLEVKEVIGCEEFALPSLVIAEDPARLSDRGISSNSSSLGHNERISLDLLALPNTQKQIETDVLGAGLVASLWQYQNQEYQIRATLEKKCLYK